MLGKLMKYEWKSTAKIVSIILLVVAGVTLLGAVGIILPSRYLMAHGENIYRGGDIVAVFMAMSAMMTFFIYVFSLGGVNYVLYGYQSVRFYKTMYTDEGYLTHTLPMKPGEVLLGKTLVAAAWSVILNLCVILSMVVLFGIGMAVSRDALEYMGIPELSEIISEVREALVSEGYLTEAIHFILAVVGTVFLTPIGTLLMIFGGLSIGQLSRKHKLLFGILSIVGILFVNSILSQIFRVLFTLAAMASMNPETVAFMGYIGALDSGFLTALIMGGLMYFVTYLILSKKLNLE